MSDPEFIDPIFGGPGKRRDKYKVAVNGYSAPYSGVGTRYHEVHRRRRAPLNPFFSKKNVRKLEPVLQRTLQKVLERLDRSSKSGEVMVTNTLYSAATSDIISDHCFGESSNNLDKEDLSKPYFSAFHDAGKGFHFITWNPWFVPTIEALPQWVVALLIPQLEIFLQLMQDLNRRLTNVKMEIKDIGSSDNTESTVFHSLLRNPNLSIADKSDERMLEEARVMLGAGTDTTSITLTAITYQILANPAIFKKLRAELIAAIPDPNNEPVLSQIEALPYLTAVIQEGIRMHPGGSIRQERVAPDEDLLYEDRKTGKKWIINRGIPVGMTAPLLSRNEEIYPEPSVFRPERYIDNPRLDKYQLAFSRGPRRCLGMALAYSELYVILSGIFRKYDLYDGTGKQSSPTLELYQTGRDDVDMVADYAIPYVRDESLGVRVKVRGD
ncbi:related to trichodiene oxygenase cytochrome P450 [Rhynchosporium secalis]|uniref:Related to trichodiene oxygenase cytochrome P450 n=1 Tax=Rhynchosporium secalis TaxID=38038 RepID=A0A1E1MBN5_RHYSE|nr:related to trichodiene oxygenase cytochrome P450 [Rhynchosporium secalis]